MLFQSTNISLRRRVVFLPRGLCFVELVCVIFALVGEAGLTDAF